MILSADDSIDDLTECNGNYVKPREGDFENVEDATLDDDCSNEVDNTDNCFHWKGQDKVG
jgi:hypothetical protein